MEDYFKFLLILLIIFTQCYNYFNITTAADTVHSVGTQFIADQDIDIFGTKGVRLESAQNTHSSSYTSQQRSSGLSRAGLGVSIGSSRSSEQGDTQATSSVANTVAALNGNITIHSSQGNVDAAGSTNCLPPATSAPAASTLTWARSTTPSAPTNSNPANKAA